MPEGKKYTKNEHYIPQIYLRGFSSDYLLNENGLNKDKYRIYYYDLVKNVSSLMPVPIKNICYEKNLYEVTGQDGSIVLRNYLEHILSRIEKMFGQHRILLEKKVFLDNNYKTKCFLKGDEKIFWVTYMLIQMLRLPQVLQLAEQVSEDMLGNDLTLQQVKNFARTCCLPFFKELKEDSPELFAFNALLEPMENMSFAVGVDMESRLITSDNPVFIYAEDFPCKEYDRIIFPITSQICLFLFGNQLKETIYKNVLFPIDKDMREEIFKSVAVSAHKQIYSNHEWNNHELKLIKKIVKCKKEG